MVNQIAKDFVDALINYYVHRLEFERIGLGVKDGYESDGFKPKVSWEGKLSEELNNVIRIQADLDKYDSLGEIMELYYQGCSELYDYDSEDGDEILKTIEKMHDAEDALARYGYRIEYGFEAICMMKRK